MLAHRRLETVEMILRLPFERDVDDDGNRRFGLRGIHERRIAADHARLFHQSDTPQTGGR